MLIALREVCGEREELNMSGSDPVVAYIDGGARGNPGPAGYGVRIEAPDGTLIEEFGQSIGVGHQQRRRVPSADRRARMGPRARAQVTPCPI